MNYQVSRIRLASVGPEPARYDPLDLDLRNHDHSGPADTVLWLPNTGGKTVLLRLLFGVLQPQLAEQVGSEDAQRRTHGMAGYVLERDTSHVAIEWRRATGGVFADNEVLITGQVAEWRGGRATGTPGDLNRLWYSIKGPEDLVAIDHLAFDEAGPDAARRKIVLRRYREQVDELRKDRRVSVVFADTQRDWLAHLDNLGLDPALFRYQARMNHDEAGASRLARFRDDLDFIEFFLDAVIDPAQLGVLDAEFAEVADKVQRYPEMQRRLEFAEAAIAHLEPLATEVAGARAAAGDLAVARTDGGLLLARFEAARSVVEARHGAARQRETDRGEDARQADRRSQALYDEAREFHRLMTSFAFDEVKEEHDIADKRVKAAQLDERAWNAVEELFRLREANAVVGALDDAYLGEIERLRPLQESRDRAGTFLLSRLAADAVLAAASATRESNDAQEQVSNAKATGEERTQALIEATELDGERHTHERALDAVRTRRDRLVAAGLLAADEATSVALAREQDLATTARDRIDAIAGGVSTSERERGELDRADEVSAPEISTTTTALDAARTDVDRATRERDALFRDPLLSEVAEDEGFDLEVVGPALADRLLARARDAESKRVILEVRGAEDRRALASLDEDGLLPPPVDVVRALDRLRAAGIDGAMPGTRYLATAVRSQQRADVLARRADLVAGIVITDPEAFERARGVLSNAALDPSIVIAVGPAADLVAAEQGDGTTAFVVPPAPAVWDRDAGPGERTVRETRVANLDTERQALEQRASTARSLSADVVRHLAAYPAGWLSARASEAASLAAQLERLTASRDDRRTRRREISLALEALRTETEERNREAQSADRRADDLGRLLEDEAGVADATAAVDRLKVEADEWRGAAERSEREAERLTGLANQAARAAAAHVAAEERVRNEMRAVELADRPADPSSADADGIIERLGDLTNLRASFDTLDRKLKGELSESDVAARRSAAIRARDEVGRRLESLATDARARAEILASTPEAGDPAGRVDAVQRALSEADAARAAERLVFSAREQAQRDLQVATDAVAAARRPVRISPERMPSDRLTAARYEAESTTRAQAAGIEATDAARDRDQAKEEAGKAAALLETLKGLSAQLRIALRFAEDDKTATADAYEGDADTARSEGVAAAARLTAAQDADARADRTWRERVDRLRRDLAAEEYRDLATTDRLHRRLSSATPDQLAASVGEDVIDVRTTIGVLRADLANLADDIRVAVTALAREVRSALSHLRGAERDSKMPPSLRGWGGEPFLTIRFENPPADELEPRLTTFVHEIVRRPASQRPTGIALLRQAVARAVAGGFSVKVLKPNEGFEVIRIPVTDLASVTVSGGQRSTVATAVLLMLSERRRKTRSTAHPASVGTLFLDNPFGTANAGFLIDVQRTVAEAAGIQLIYSTGIADFAALRRFPNPIALSNDSARRTMRKYVRTNPDLLALLTPADDSPGGKLGATRVVATSAGTTNGNGRTRG